MAIRGKNTDKDTYYSLSQVEKWVDKGAEMGLIPNPPKTQKDIDNTIKWVQVLVGKEKTIIIEKLY